MYIDRGWIFYLFVSTLCPCECSLRKYLGFRLIFLVVFVQLYAVLWTICPCRFNVATQDEEKIFVHLNLLYRLNMDMWSIIFQQQQHETYMKKLFSNFFVYIFLKINSKTLSFFFGGGANWAKRRKKNSKKCLWSHHNNTALVKNIPIWICPSHEKITKGN